MPFWPFSGTGIRVGQPAQGNNNGSEPAPRRKSIIPNKLRPHISAELIEEIDDLHDDKRRQLAQLYFDDIEKDINQNRAIVINEVMEKLREILHGPIVEESDDVDDSNKEMIKSKEMELQLSVLGDVYKQSRIAKDQATLTIATQGLSQLSLKTHPQDRLQLQLPEASLQKFDAIGEEATRQITNINGTELEGKGAEGCATLGKCVEQQQMSIREIATQSNITQRQVHTNNTNLLIAAIGAQEKVMLAHANNDLELIKGHNELQLHLVTSDKELKSQVHHEDTVKFIKQVDGVLKLEELNVQKEKQNHEAAQKRDEEKTIRLKQEQDHNYRMKFGDTQHERDNGLAILKEKHRHIEEMAKYGVSKEPTKNATPAADQSEHGGETSD